MRSLTKNRNLIIAILLAVVLAIAGVLAFVFTRPINETYAADNYGEFKADGYYDDGGLVFYAIKVKTNYSPTYKLAEDKLQFIKYGETVILNEGESILISFARQEDTDNALEEKLVGNRTNGYLSDYVSFLDIDLSFNEKIAENVTEGFKKIEDAGVGGYKKIEEGVVSGYKKIEEILLASYALATIGRIRPLEEKKDFVRLFGALLKLRNLLVSFDEFDLKTGCILDEDKKVVDHLLLNDYQIQDYTSWYIDLRDEFRQQPNGESVVVNDDVVFEIELVKQVQIGMEYILALVAEHHQSNCQDKEVTVKIQKAISASPDLRNKKDLIEQFIERMTPTESDDVMDNWDKYVAEQRAADLQSIIDEEKLKPAETQAFMAHAFEDGRLSTIGTSVSKLLPPMPLFGGGGKRIQKRRSVIEKLQAFFDKYFNL